MPRRSAAGLTAALVPVLLFLLVTLLGVAAGNLAKNTGVLPWGLELIRRELLSLAGVTVLLIIGRYHHLARQVVMCPPLNQRPLSPQASAGRVWSCEKVRPPAPMRWRRMHAMAAVVGRCYTASTRSIVAMLADDHGVSGDPA